jgi:SulP family sulfate permease
MEKAGFLDEIGRENVCPHVAAALERAREILGLPPEVVIDSNAKGSGSEQPTETTSEKSGTP